MTTALPHLDQPIRLGPLEVRNRLFVAAHSTNFAERLSSERLGDYYVERARGGVGMIIHEPVIAHPSSLSRPTKVWGFDAGNIDAYRRTADRVHAEGAAFVCQILHNGAHMGSTFTAGPLWAPSEVTDAMSGEAAHAMSLDEIEAVVEGFATSAAICRDGGFDGVELHGSHGYLVQQFLSPLTNRRTDAYGGDDERRRRFLLDIISAVRDRVGRDFVVGVRIAGDERTPGGMTTADASALVARLEADGAVDYVNVSTGGSVAAGWIVLDATYERRANVEVAAAIKASTTLPVLVAGRIARVAEAEDVVASGQADMVGVVRALMADPQWYAKGRAREEASTRPCTYCNECVYGIGTFRAIRCTVNPDLGHEGEATRRAAPSTARRVVVVGGGVAGLEAALTAARRGHEVVLLERDPVLGGQLRVVPPTGIRVEVEHLRAHLGAAVVAAGVDVRCGVVADAAAVLALQPDAVVVATGSGSAAVPWAGATSALVVLDGSASVGHRVLVAQDGTHPWELDVVLEHLLARGHEVVTVVAGPAFVPRGTDAALPARLARAGLVVEPWSALVRGSDPLELRDVLTGSTRPAPAADDVVVATARLAEGGLVDELRGRVEHVEGVGDALAPRSIRDAISEAHAAALRIGATTTG